MVLTPVLIGSLRNFFESYGAVETAEVIYNRDTKKSRGFGFVVFKEFEPVTKVLDDQRKSLIVIDGKQVEVKRCVARQESGSTSKDVSKSRTKRNDTEKEWSRSFDQQNIYSPCGEHRAYANSSISHDDFYLDEPFYNTQDDYYGGEEDSSIYRNERAVSSSSTTSFFNAFGSPRNNHSPFQAEYGSPNELSPGSLHSPLPPLSLDGFHSVIPSPSGLDSSNIWGGASSVRSPSNSSVHEGGDFQQFKVQELNSSTLLFESEPQQFFGSLNGDEFGRDSAFSADSVDQHRFQQQPKELSSFLSFADEDQQQQ